MVACWGAVSLRVASLFTLSLPSFMLASTADGERSFMPACMLLLPSFIDKLLSFWIKWTVRIIPIFVRPRGMRQHNLDQPGEHPVRSRDAGVQVHPRRLKILGQRLEQIVRMRRKLGLLLRFGRSLLRIYTLLGLFLGLGFRRGLLSRGVRGKIGRE